MAKADAAALISCRPSTVLMKAETMRLR